MNVLAVFITVMPLLLAIALMGRSAASVTLDTAVIESTALVSNYSDNNMLIRVNKSQYLHPAHVWHFFRYFYEAF